MNTTNFTFSFIKGVNRALSQSFNIIVSYKYRSISLNKNSMISCVDMCQKQYGRPVSNNVNLDVP